MLQAILGSLVRSKARCTHTIYIHTHPKINHRIQLQALLTYCLVCSRLAYVTLTTAVSLSVFTDTKKKKLNLIQMKITG